MTINWEKIGAYGAGHYDLLRASVPGGWLVIAYTGVDPTCPPMFIPDPDHVWGREVEDKPKPTRCLRVLLGKGDQCCLIAGHKEPCSFAVDPFTF